MSISSHRIMAWLSPSFPTGAFAYSHGLEYAIHAGDVTNAAELRDWLEVLLRFGAARNDAILLAHAYRGEEVLDLASALAGSKERHQETWDQGRAFARTAQTLLDVHLDAAPLPCVLAQAAAEADIELEEFLPMALHAFAANLVSVAIRLVPLGQTEGQTVLQNLFPIIDDIAAEAMAATLDDLGNMAFRADIAAMKHETMTTRIFRT
ncbi:MAG: urease accessory UreF family protein [Pseudomonadota bacterium]